MVKMIVTVPCMIGGKPYAVDQVVEVDETTARALTAIKRAVIHVEPGAGEVPADEGDKKGKKAKG